MKPAADKTQYVIESIKAVRLFSQLTSEEIQGIIGRIDVRKFEKGEVVLYHEDTNEYMYIVLNGEVKVSRLTDEGKEVIVAICQNGEYFGEMSLIDGNTASATVTATRDSLLAVISKNNFEYLLYSNRKVMESLLSNLCSRVRGATSTIEMLNYNLASRRIEILFTQLAKKYGMDSIEGITIKIKLTHQDIADMTGLTRQTITRVIDEWKTAGLITVVENKFIRLNPGFPKDESFLEAASH
jgi:CRP/FNR family cyclic AMP-dependent transcriptional regulator